jgi:ligand-binding sensor domain-containing protein
VARFDGQKFTVFDHVNTPEMTDDNCRKLFEDGNGNLLASAHGERYEYLGNQSPGFVRRRELHGSAVPILCGSRQGGFWGESVSAILRIKQGTVIEFRKSDPVWGGDRASVMAEDKMGILWIGLGGGVLRFDPQTKQFERPSPGPEFWILPVVALSPNANGECWMLFSEKDVQKSRKVWLACMKDRRWLRLPRIEKPDFVCDPRSFFLVEDQSGALWLPAVANSLHRYKDGEFQMVSLPNSGRDDFVLCVYPDREGNLWIGTESSGLQYWQPRKVSSYTTRDGLANESTWTICEARDGSMWIGTEQGVSQLKAGRFHNFAQRDGLAKDPVRSIAEDASGSIWIGTGGGLNVIRDGVLGRQPFPHEPERDKTRVVYPARAGAVWLGTADGLFRFQDGAWTTFRTTNGLANNDVRALHEDQAGNLWIGTAGGGVQRFYHGAFTTFTTINGLANNSAWAFHEDKQAVIWIGTEGGLSRLEGERIISYTTREGLPDNLVNSILEDDVGRLWIGHDRGIYWVHRTDLNAVATGEARPLRCVSYDEAGGLLSIETNGQKSNPAACKTRDGRLWFPTTKGVAIIDPSKVALDDVPPLAAIEQVRGNGVVVFGSSPEDLSQSKTNSTFELTSEVIRQEVF